MLTIKYHETFRADYKSLKRRGYDVRLLEETIDLLMHEKSLPEWRRDRVLPGKNYEVFRECRVAPGWLLVYKVDPDTKSLVVIRTGAISKIF